MIKGELNTNFVILIGIVSTFSVFSKNYLFSVDLLGYCEKQNRIEIFGFEGDEKKLYRDSLIGQFGLPNPKHCNQLDTTLCYSAQPFPIVDFAIEKKFESAENALIYQSPLLADIDGDCIPEIIVAGVENYMGNPRLISGIKIQDSRTGETKISIPTPMYSWSAPNSFVVGDIDMDGLPEIILAAADHFSNPAELRGRLICYYIDGSVKWISDQKFGKNVAFGYGGNLALADFNQDGIPEVYIYNEIFNAQNGVKLAEGGNNGLGLSNEATSNGSVSIVIAANLNGDNSTLELAAGYTIYEVDIVNVNGMDGNLMTPFNFELDGEFRDGLTSVADVNGDKNLDVIVSSIGVFPNGKLYVFQLTNGESNLIASTSPENGNGSCCRENMGPPFVGDIDGSGIPSIGVTRSLKLTTFKYNGTEILEKIWSINTNDNSGWTGMTMFDFNQDGIMEIVYRDERNLRIINGSINPPQDLATFNCFSGTGVEHPIVGDIDNSGSSKIVVGCSESLLGAIGKMTVFSSPEDKQPWAPSRGIWNQFNYHVFNINDDLTVPIQQKNNASYSNGLFNNFYVQASLLDEDGTFLQRVPSLSGFIECIDYDPDSDQFTVSFSLFNDKNSSLLAAEGVPISFFDNNPETNGGLIGRYMTTESLNPGDTLWNLQYTFNRGNNIDSFFMLINFDGNSLNGPINEDDFKFLECNYGDNIQFSSFFPGFDTIQVPLCSGDTFELLDSIYEHSGIYYQKLLNQDGCDSIVIQLTIESIEVTQDTLSVSSCESYLWEVSDIEYSESGIYSYLIANENGCDSLLFLDLTVYKAWTVTVETETTCEGEENGVAMINYHGLNENEIEGMSLNGQIREPVSSITGLRAGQYQLKVVDVLGCAKDINFEIPTYKEPIVELSDLEVNCEDESGFLEVKIVSGDIEDLTIEWINGTQGPQLFVEEIGIYNTTVHSKCSSYNLSAEVFIPESDQILDVFVPNAFSPNLDGVNDVFYPFFDPSVEILNYSLIILDRWGNKVFESSDPGYGWDGVFAKKNSEFSVFLWLLEAEIIYCRRQQIIKKHGEITVLR